MRPATRWHLRPPAAPAGPFRSALDTPGPAPDREALRQGEAAVTHENDVRLLVGGHEVLPRLLDAIAEAEHSVHIEVMLFFNDDAGYQVRDALLRRMDETEGRLRVRLLYDYLATTVGDPFLSKGNNPFQVSTFIAPLRGAGAQVIDSSFIGDDDPARLTAVADFIPADLRDSILNFPYEVRRAYRWLNAGTVKLLGSPRMQRPIGRALRWAERHKTAFAEKLTPHRLITRYAIHDHRKIIVVDGELAFCGGMNIGQEYLYRHPFDEASTADAEQARPGNPEPWPKWHDSCCELQGPVVNVLQRLFLKRFERCGGSPPSDDERRRLFPEPRALSGPATARTGGMTVAVATSVPGRPSDIEREALAMLTSARDSALLRNPYLVRLGFLGAIADAARRGVAMRVVIPRDYNDSAIHDGYMRSWVPYLLRQGVELREYLNHFSHAKVLSVDGKRTLLGSFNYNNRSSVLDFECAFVVDDATFAAETERRLLDDDVAAGLAPRLARDATAGELAQTVSSLLVFELWSTFL